MTERRGFAMKLWVQTLVWIAAALAALLLALSSPDQLHMGFDFGWPQGAGSPR
jgi:hypothetical protein